MSRRELEIRPELLVLFLYLLFCIPIYWIDRNHSYHPSDDGLILAYSWRIWNGEIPHRDFIFTRPFLSPLLHTVWFLLPETLVFKAARASYFMELILTGILPAAWALKKRFIRISVTTLAALAISMLFAIHNLQPMPWYTLDAVLLSVIGMVLFLYSLQERKNRLPSPWLRFASGVSFALAAFAKQTFAIMTVIFLLCSIWDFLRQQRNADQKQMRFLVKHLSAGVLGTLAAALSAILYLTHYGALSDFWSQIRQVSNQSDLELIGVRTHWFYFQKNLAFFGAGLMLGLHPVLSRYVRFKALLSFFYILPFVLFCLASAELFSGRVLPAFGFSLFAFALGLFLVAFFRFFQSRSQRSWIWLIFVLFTIAIGWTSSLSMGWRTPSLALAPVGILFAWSLRTFPRTIISPAVLKVIGVFSAIFVLCALTFQHLNFPYKDSAWPAQVWNLGQLYPKFGTLYTNRITFARVQKIKELSEQAQMKLKRPVVVMPEFPLFYYMQGVRNPVCLDWWWPPDYRGFEKRVVDQFLQVRPVVILETLQIHEQTVPFYDGQDYISMWVMKHGKFIGRSGTFLMFVINGN